MKKCIIGVMFITMVVCLFPKVINNLSGETGYFKMIESLPKKAKVLQYLSLSSCTYVVGNKTYLYYNGTVITMNQIL